MTYPAFPDIPIRTFGIRINPNKATFDSSFTGQRSSVSLVGGTSDRWEGAFTTPVLSPSQVKTMVNFLVKVGLYGRFTMAHPDYDGAESGASLGLVVGAGQSGRTLLVDGFGNEQLVIRKGEYFQVRDEFKRSTRNITSDASGKATFRFEPPLRVSPADDDPVDLASPVMLLELLSVPSEDTDSLGMQSFTVQFQEAMIYE